MRLDALVYSQDTYGDPKSPEYRQLEKEFCSKVCMHTNVLNDIAIFVIIVLEKPE